MSDTSKERKIPKHVGVIMDGNGRWAKSRGLTRTEGHREGLKTAKVIVKAAEDLGIKYLSLFVFSTDHRQSQEVYNNMCANLFCAPAIWASAVSTVTIKSIWLIIATVSSKFSIFLLKSMILQDALDELANSLDASPSCKL